MALALESLLPFAPQVFVSDSMQLSSKWAVPDSACVRMLGCIAVQSLNPGLGGDGGIFH